MIIEKLCEIIILSLICLFLVRILVKFRKYKNIEEWICFYDKNDLFFCIIMDIVDYE